MSESKETVEQIKEYVREVGLTRAINKMASEMPFVSSNKMTGNDVYRVYASGGDILGADPDAKINRMVIAGESLERARSAVAEAMGAAARRWKSSIVEWREGLDRPAHITDFVDIVTGKAVVEVPWPWSRDVTFVVTVKRSISDVVWDSRYSTGMVQPAFSREVPRVRGMVLWTEVESAAAPRIGDDGAPTVVGPVTRCSRSHLDGKCEDCEGVSCPDLFVAGSMAGEYLNAMSGSGWRVSMGIRVGDNGSGTSSFDAEVVVVDETKAAMLAHGLLQLAKEWLRVPVLPSAVQPPATNRPGSPRSRSALGSFVDGLRSMMINYPNGESSNVYDYTCSGPWAPARNQLMSRNWNHPVHRYDRTGARLRGEPTIPTAILDDLSSSQLMALAAIFGGGIHHDMDGLSTAALIRSLWHAIDIRSNASEAEVLARRQMLEFVAGKQSR